MTVKVTNPNNPEETYEYHIDAKLKRFLDRGIMKDLEKKDKDFVMIVDGYEGSGKSTFAMQLGRYVDPTLHLDRICMNAEQFREAVLNSKKNQCIIYDEAVTGMSSSESLTKVGRMLKSLMMQMRQKNLFVIIIMPWLFDFYKYAVLGRARCFFHIYESGGRRGYWVGYNRKDMRRTYMMGKKTYTYRVKSIFRGRFYGKAAINDEAYRKKKERFLIESTRDPKEKHTKRELQIGVIMYALRNELGITNNEKITEILKKYKYDISRRQVDRIYNVGKSVVEPKKDGI